MPLRLLKTRNGLFVAFANLTLSWVSFSILYFYPLFFEIVKQNSASRAGKGFLFPTPFRTPSAVADFRLLCAGAHLLPNSIALSVGSLFAGYVSPPTRLPKVPES